MNMADFALRLKFARKRKKLTASALADAMGVHRLVIANLERGARSTLTVEELILFASALDVDATSLVPELSSVLPGARENDRLRGLLTEIASKAVSA